MTHLINPLMKDELLIERERDKDIYSVKSGTGGCVTQDSAPSVESPKGPGWMTNVPGETGREGHYSHHLGDCPIRLVSV